MYGATFPMSSASSAIVVIGCRGKQLGDAGVQFHASTIRHRGRATRSVDKNIKGESKKEKNIWLRQVPLLLSLVLTPNQARGGWRGVKPAVPPTSTCMWAVLKDRVATQIGDVDQILVMRARSICVSMLTTGNSSGG